MLINCFIQVLCLLSLEIIQMKIVKVKRTANSSFVTNHDLLQCLRNNRSIVASREHSTRLHSNHSKVSLIQKKNYDRMLTQENDSLIINTSPNFTPSPADQAIVLLQDCLTTIGDSNQKLAHKLKKVIAYVREVKNEEAKKQQNKREIEKENEKALLKKLEISCQQKAILKMQNEQLKAKLNEYRQKLSSLKKQRRIAIDPTGARPVSGLEQLVVSQSQLIDMQCLESKREGEEFRRMLQIQALKIQQMLMRQGKTRPLQSPATLRY